MALITIDHEKCVKDGICAAECPVRIIDVKNGFPEIINGTEAFCINCGHCVAVCPTAAFSHKKLTPEECMEVNGEVLSGPEQMEHLLRSRRSIRNYKKKQVPGELLEKLISIASHAPSGHNRQPVQWHVVYERETLDVMCGHVIDWMKWMIKEQPERAAFMNLELIVEAHKAGIDTVTRDAPHLIIAHANKKDITAQAACTIAMTWLDLAIPSFGLGGCWCGYFAVAAMFWPPLQKALGLPAENVVHCTMMVGHPKYSYQRMPPRNKPVITGL